MSPYINSCYEFAFHVKFMIYKFRQEYVYEEYGVIIYEIRWYKGSR